MKIPLFSAYFENKKRVHQETSQTNNSQDIATAKPAEYVSDDPVLQPQEDKFGRYPFAARIAKTIALKSDPSSIVVAIYGPWGDGKSSVLNFIESELAQSSSVITVRFNPWRFENELVLLQSYFNTLAAALKRRLEHRAEMLAKKIQEYGSLLSLALGSWGEAATKLAGTLSEVSVDELKRRIEVLLEQEQKRIVVLMDDIDRLDKTEVQSVLKLIKLTGDFKYTAYVLAFDEEMVARVVGEKYGGSADDNYSAGHNFLEKVVQVPLHLPPIPRAALYAYCYEAINQALTSARTEITPVQAQTFALHFEGGVGSRLKTPRLAKRYANALAFSLAILRNEVHAGDLMLVEALRIFYSKLYDELPRHREMLLGIGDFRQSPASQKQVDELIKTAMPELNEAEQQSARELLQTLFPRTGTKQYGYDWDEEWARTKRIASKDYFLRFFTYAIGEADISDVAVDKFLSSMASKGVDQLVEDFAKITTRKNAEIVIAKLRLQERQLDAERCSLLARVVARSANLLPNAHTITGLTQPFAQSGILVTQLLKSLPQSKRMSLASQIIAEANPLFACEFMRWVVAGEDKKEEPALPSHEESDLKKQFVSRTMEYLRSLGQPVFVLEPQNAVFYLASLKASGGAAEVKQYLTDTIGRNPAFALPLIKIFSPEAFSLESGEPLDPGFMRQQYSQIAELIEPEVLTTALTQQYSDLTTLKESNLSGDWLLAYRFVRMHEQLKAKGAAKRDNTDTNSPRSETDDGSPKTNS